VIGISLLTLVPGVVGGSETYARELVCALSRVGELEYRVFTSSLAPDATDGLPGDTVRHYRASRSISGRLLAVTVATASPGLRKELELERFEGLHFPLTVAVPPVRQPPAVVTLHDLQHELQPQFFSRAERAWRRVVYRPSVRRARFLIVPSEHVREMALERLGLDAGRVRAIPHGVDHERFRPANGSREPFLLYPAKRWPHKNHERLFEAFQLLRRERPDLRLSLTGFGEDRRPVPDGVEARGYVTREELADLYARASALVFPSLYEGFGLPPLEAMASGCPAAVSNAGALPEVCGDAARLFDPTSPEEIAAAVFDVLAGPQPYVKRGLERAAEFTWERSASAHDAVYRELVS
jgi:glycosyltransferase involved in cell wall biosynthesis